MNPIPEQLPKPPKAPDWHWHKCEHCGCTFSHTKSCIPEGMSHRAHQCPACRQQVNTREATVVPPSMQLQFVEWYGFDVRPLPYTGTDAARRKREAQYKPRATRPKKKGR